jgi:hypothetical protein
MGDLQGYAEDECFAHLIVKSATQKEVFETASDCDFGLLLRESNVVNRVACPTKLIEYLAAGVVPVLDAPDVGDFVDLGMQFVPIDEFMRGHFPSPEERRRIAIHNLAVCERLRAEARDAFVTLSRKLAQTTSPDLVA